MLRRMCRECVRKDEDLYTQRVLTGEILDRVIVGKQTVTILQCSRCGHAWSYSRKTSPKTDR